MIYAVFTSSPKFPRPLVSPWCKGGSRYVKGWWGVHKRKMQTTQAEDANHPKQKMQTSPSGRCKPPKRKMQTTRSYIAQLILFSVN